MLKSYDIQSFEANAPFLETQINNVYQENV